MTPPKVWVCVELTREQCIGEDFEAARDCIADAIRAALERTEQPWVGWQLVVEGKLAHAIEKRAYEYEPCPGCRRVLVVPLGEEK